MGLMLSVCTAWLVFGLGLIYSELKEIRLAIVGSRKGESK